MKRFHSRNFPCGQALNSEQTVGEIFILKQPSRNGKSYLFQSLLRQALIFEEVEPLWSFNVTNTQTTTSKVHQECKRPGIFLDVTSSSPSSCGRNSGHVPASAVLITSHLCLRNTRNENKRFSILLWT